MTLLLPSCTDPAPPDAPATPHSAVPFGVAALTDLLTIGELRPPGTAVLQTSSYDRTGANSDTGFDANAAALLETLGVPAITLEQSYLYREGDRFVLFDEHGPGVLDRVWMTGFDSYFFGTLGGDIAFEFDEEAEPRWTGTRMEWFSGTAAPFLAPLTGNAMASSGGYYNALPLAFARRLRITSSIAPFYLHFTWTRLPPGTPVTTFEPAEDTIAVAARLDSAGGDDPKGVTPDLLVERPLDVAPGAELLVWEHRGAGTVLGIELLGGGDDDLPGGLVLEATWDGASEPQVKAPLADLFGASLGSGARSFAFGRAGERHYFFLPMPFASSARLAIRNEGEATFAGFRMRLSAVERRLGRAPGYFHAASRSERTVPGGPDYTLLDTPGSGHVVGVVMTAACAEAGACRMEATGDVDGSHLEGDERIRVDGSRWPQVHGTGLEDFFSAGFYFQHGPFTLPTHGNPVHVPVQTARHPGVNVRSMYRLMLAEAIPFRAGIRLSVEHGPTNDVAAELSSTVFYYGIPDATTVRTDTIELDGGSSESEHALGTEGRVDHTVTSAFRGEESARPFTATGFGARVTRFRVAVDPDNQGVRLRRLADIEAGRQAAAVRVDGKDAGTWATADVNPVLRWAQLDFEVPASISRGRDFIEVELDATGSPTPWTAYGYEAWSHRAVPAE